MTAMATLGQATPAVPKIPRLGDGMVDLSEPMRIMAESLANEVMGAGS